jgi:hypothetical protein
MDIRVVIAPLVAQVFLTLGLLLYMAYQRYHAVKAKEVKVIDAAASNIVWPRMAAQAQRSFLNQFETPVLFYALVPLVVLTKTYDTLFIVLAWVWFASRLAHALVHCTNNKLSLRFPTFLVGVVVLIAMWIIFAVKLFA